MLEEVQELLLAGQVFFSNASGWFKELYKELLVYYLKRGERRICFWQIVNEMSYIQNLYNTVHSYRGS